MKYYVLLLSMLVIASCQHKKPLAFEDLKYLAQDDIAASRNRVDSISIVVDKPAPFHSEKLNRFLKDGSLVGLIVYDSLGRMSYDGTNLSSTYRFEYDSAGVLAIILWRDWDIYFHYGVSYKFVPDSSILHIMMNDKRNASNNSGFEEKLTFSADGRLIEKFSTGRKEWNDIEGLVQAQVEGRKMQVRDKVVSRVTKYGYNDDGTLGIEEECESSANDTKRLSIKRLYYSDHLDSIVTDNQWYGYKSRTFYDSTGLKIRTIYNDTLAVRYEYSRRKR